MIQTLRGYLDAFAGRRPAMPPQPMEEIIVRLRDFDVTTVWSEDVTTLLELLEQAGVAASEFILEGTFMTNFAINWSCIS